MEWVKSGQFSMEQEEYPLAWEAFNSTAPALDRALEARELLMLHYNLTQIDADRVVGQFLQSGRRTAGEDGPDPDYSFMYYKSAVEVVPWTHNVRYRDIAKRLLNKFNAKPEETWNDEGEWAGGDIYKEEDGLRVEFRQLADPETQAASLEALRAWWKDQPREDDDIEWSMESEESLPDNS